MDDVSRIVKEIKNGQIRPIYFLMGEEPYYIDKISEYIENTVLDESERDFNQVVLYGADVTVEDITSNAKRFPMMAERQVVIVKEAQHLTRTLDKLEAYAANPQTTTVLVFCYKYKTLDKRKKLYKNLKKTGEIFESKKMYENQIPDWIRRVLSGKGYAIDNKAAEMLVEFLGNDLSRIDNELQKLKYIVPEGSQITPEHIEQNIGISKDFNNFELRNALGEKDMLKATRIINYFAENPKNNPLPVTMALLYNFFNQIMMYHGLSDHSKQGVASALKMSPYRVDELKTAARNYPMKKVSRVIGYLRDIDMKSKGVGTFKLSQADLLKELLVKMMY